MNADTSKCNGYACPVREDCLRYTSTPHPTRQVWMMPAPDTVGPHGCPDMIRNARTLPPPDPGENHPPYNARWIDP